MKFLIPADFPYVVTSRFDAPRDYPFAPGKKQLHEGIDFAPKVSDSLLRVVSPQNGSVVKVGWDQRGYGNFVVIDHGEGWRSWLAHMKAPCLLRLGSKINIGDFVGYAGSTGGTSTGVHVHMTIQHIPAGLRGYVVDYVINPEPLLITESPQKIVIGGSNSNTVAALIELVKLFHNGDIDIS